MAFIVRRWWIEIIHKWHHTHRQTAQSGWQLLQAVQTTKKHKKARQIAPLNHSWKRLLVLFSMPKTNWLTWLHRGKPKNPTPLKLCLARHHAWSALVPSAGLPIPLPCEEGLNHPVNTNHVHLNLLSPHKENLTHPVNTNHVYKYEFLVSAQLPCEEGLYLQICTSCLCTTAMWRGLNPSHQHKSH